MTVQSVKYDPQIGMFDSFENDWMACNDEDYEAFFAAPVVQLADAAGDLYSIRQRSCVTTNAKVEYDLRKWYSAFDPRLQPWNRFDMIIVDEVHSLFSDATYQSASFYVRRLIEEILQRSKTCKVIVMTGSPKQRIACPGTSDRPDEILRERDAQNIQLHHTQGGSGQTAADAGI